MASRLFVVRKALDTQLGVSKLFAYPLALRQDRKPLEPPIIISAWIAVDAATLENSCLQIIPGSHRKVVPHVKATSEMAFGQMGDFLSFARRSGTCLVLLNVSLARSLCARTERHERLR